MSDEPKREEYECPECGETARTRRNETNWFCKTCLHEWIDEPKRDDCIFCGKDSTWALTISKTTRYFCDLCLGELLEKFGMRIRR